MVLDYYAGVLSQTFFSKFTVKYQTQLTYTQGQGNNFRSSI